MDIGRRVLGTVITYFFCNLWRSGAFPLSTLRDSVHVNFTRIAKTTSVKELRTISGGMRDVIVVSF